MANFYVISISEPIINSDHKDLYKIDEYNSFYYTDKGKRNYQCWSNV